MRRRRATTWARQAASLGLAGVALAFALAMLVSLASRHAGGATIALIFAIGLACSAEALWPSSP